MLKKGLCVFYLIAVFVLYLVFAFTPEVKVTLTTADPNVNYELFYAKPLPVVFVAEQRLGAKATVEGKKKVVRFQLPFATPGREFRLDLGGRVGEVFVLHKLEMSSLIGFWEKRVDFASCKKITLNHHLQRLPGGENGLKLMSKGGDPFLVIGLPERSSFRISGGSLLGIGVLFLLLFPFIWRKRSLLILEKGLAAGKVFWEKVKPFCLNLKKISPYWVLVIVFLILFGFGVTGSSIGLSRNSCVAEPVGEKLLLGRYRSIRSDEFIAHGTASAIQSYKNDQQFEVVNSNIGLSGRNFLFLHDNGAPVKHLSMLIRPSNWMFFVTGLRHALAWYWFFPIFFGIFALLFLLNTLFKNDPWLHAVLALGAVFSPYCAGWSFWPINCSAGAFLAAAALIRMVRSSRKTAVFGYALLAGWGFSVSAATLYFPHIWPCVSLALLIGLIEIVPSLKEKKGIWIKMAGFLLFAVVSAGLLYTFFSAIREPVELAMGSAISGRIRHGGLFQVWELLKGWFFPITFFQHWYFNQCEDQAFQFIVIPLLLCFVWQYKTVVGKPLCIALFAFLFWALIYQFVGWDPVLTKITFWNRCTEPRVSYAIQIAQFLLLAALAQGGECREKSRQFVMAVLMTVLILIAAFLILLGMPENFWATAKKISFFTFLSLITLCFGIFTLVNALILYHVKWGAIAFSLVLFLGGFLFNPLCLAPTDFTSPLVEAIRKKPDLKYGGRVLLSGNSLVSFHSQNYVMAGGKVFNSFFCYEDTKIHELLLKNLPNSAFLHRLNHMTVKFVPGGPLLSAEVPQGDCIRLNFNGRKFDFSKLPIDYIYNLVYNGNGGLEHNKSVKYCGNVGIWQLWKVVR